MQKCLVVTKTGRKCKNSQNCKHHRQRGGNVSQFLDHRLTIFLKLASKEIPLAGQVLALIDVMVTNATFLKNLVELQSSSEIIRRVRTIHFQNGPDGVKEQFGQLCPPSQCGEYCNVISLLYEDLLDALCGFVETIPTVGPVVSLAIRKEAGFQMLSSIYSGLPEDSRLLFQNPERLVPIVEQVMSRIYDTMGVDAPPQTGGLSRWASNLANKALTATTMVASTLVTHEVGKIASNLNMVTSVGKKFTRPVMMGLKVAGIDQVLIDQVDKFVIEVLRPATIDAIEALKIIFPLFFALLCIADRCKNQT
jgi:hypothetical protein